MLVATALALLINTFQADFELRSSRAGGERRPTSPSRRPPATSLPPRGEQRCDEDYRASVDLARVLASAAANIFTSGQLLNLMFIVVLGALMVTNEFFHQTATATFLTTPHRTRVIVEQARSPRCSWPPGSGPRRP